MGPFFLILPPVVVGLPPVGGEGGVVRSCIGICISNPFVQGGRYGEGTIEGGWRYHIGISSTMLGRMRVAAT
jgi:hypothetical protein